MAVFLGVVFVLMLVALYLNWNVGRKQQRQRWEKKLHQLQDAHHRAAARVTELFSAVGQIRSGSGRTQASFAAVERAFGEASQQYLPLDEEVQIVASAFARGDVRPLQAQGARLEAGLADVHQVLDELQAQVKQFQDSWRAAPPALQRSRQEVAELAAALAAAEQDLGFATPVQERLAALTQYLERAESEAAQNPVAALQMADDLQLRLSSVSAEVATYRSAATAISQAQADLAVARSGPAGADPRCAGPLQEAAAAQADLVPSLQAGNLDRFQTRLLAVQSALREARRILRERGPVH